jgi:hypothetical protein
MMNLLFVCASSLKCLFLHFIASSVWCAVFRCLTVMPNVDCIFYIFEVDNNFL